MIKLWIEPKYNDISALTNFYLGAVTYNYWSAVTNYCLNVLTFRQKFLQTLFSSWLLGQKNFYFK